MLRLTQVKLQLGHTDEDLRAAMLKRLRVAAGELTELAAFRRSADPRLPDITRAKDVLGWRPSTPLRAGLEKTIAYFEGVLSADAA